MLTGNLPFMGTVEQIIIKHLTVPLPSLRAHRPDLPRDVDDVLQMATHKDWRQRYNNVLDFAADFRAAINA
jgi:hypothetical protein